MLPNTALFSQATPPQLMIIRVTQDPAYVYTSKGIKSRMFDTRHDSPVAVLHHEVDGRGCIQHFVEEDNVGMSDSLENLDLAADSLHVRDGLDTTLFQHLPHVNNALPGNFVTWQLSRTWRLITHSCVWRWERRLPCVATLRRYRLRATLHGRGPY